MTEEFLQYIWKHQLYEQKSYTATTGEEITIVHPGELNTDAGPDFVNSKIRINKTLWAGNCELHLASSDWVKHGHENNQAYDNLVLHVVHKNDATIKSKTGRHIPTIQLEYNPQTEESYKKLINSELWIACANDAGSIERFHFAQWLTSLGIERLESRTEAIQQLLNYTINNWEESFYIYLAKSFGFKVNAVPFEMLARSVPLTILAKHKSNLLQLEALMFGQAGFLSNPADKYMKFLAKEYAFLKQKYNLKPIENHLWKFLRLRPINFPTIRIAQFAALVHGSSALFGKIIEAKTIHELLTLFAANPSEYWETHYKFGIESKRCSKQLTENSIELLLINAVIPFIFIYGKQKTYATLTDKVLAFLEELKPEKNSIIEKWQSLGVEPRNAFETQALLHLKNNYCNTKQCLKCAIGNRIISNRV